MKRLAFALLTAGVMTTATAVYATRTPTPTPPIVREVAALRSAQIQRSASSLYLQERQLRTRFSPAYTGAVVNFHRKEARRYGQRSACLALGLGLVTIGVLGLLTAYRA